MTAAGGQLGCEVVGGREVGVALWQIFDHDVAVMFQVIVGMLL